MSDNTDTQIINAYDARTERLGILLDWTWQQAHEMPEKECHRDIRAGISFLLTEFEAMQEEIAALQKEAEA